MNKKCIVLFSGGLDSRLVVKIMQEKGFEVLCLYFKLPFGCSNEKEVREFVRSEKVELKIFDCTKGKLLKEYLRIIKDAKYGVGAGVNPCVDCKIFMFRKSGEFANKRKIDCIATGEVVGQRPMSQMPKSIKLIEEKSGIKNRILRPLEEIGARGRQRKKQIALAKKFGIKYPSPAGGCLLCEKLLKKRFEYLLNRGLNNNEIKLIGIGRHFLIDKFWIIIGRNKEENEIIEQIGNKIGKLIIPDYIGPSAIIVGKGNKKIEENVEELIRVYSKKGNCAPLGVPQSAECRGKERKKFERYKL